MAKLDLHKLRLPSVIEKHHGTVLPIMAMSLILVILIPLPTSIMDLLLLVNITLSGVVMLTVMYIDSPLNFSSFPSLLLGMTLFRLVLNTATTRLILTNADAGHVIQTFGGFVARGSLVVAVIIFAIIVVIQFVVITKGATRIAEVAARFTLDGMPGKQMAVDADLNAGTLTEQEAKERRADITREADFYGAMDGAQQVRPRGCHRRHRHYADQHRRRYLRRYCREGSSDRRDASPLHDPHDWRRACVTDPGLCRLRRRCHDRDTLRGEEEPR